jgi:hypothetical protein
MFDWYLNLFSYFKKGIIFGSIPILVLRHADPDPALFFMNQKNQIFFLYFRDNHPKSPIFNDQLRFRTVRYSSSSFLVGGRILMKSLDAELVPFF